MAAQDEITCPMCGFKNPAKQERCRSCGAKVEILAASYTSEEEHARRYQQEDFEWKWALLGAGLFTGLQGVILGLLPHVISAFDPQGLPGLVLSIPIFFLGGIALGIISPGKTFVEPAVGAMLAAIPTLTVVSMRTPPGAFEPTLLAYIVCAIMGVMTALFGAFVGEKWQMGSARSQPRSR
jgi:DNA-directed RNA polymerase subunit RPC12/RpoP